MVWEKKTATRGGDIHCWTDTYTWAAVFTSGIAALNTAPCFGHCDWRSPNMKELMSIVDYGKSSPVVSAEFNGDTGSGRSASCTATSYYWSSTSAASNSAVAFLVEFSAVGAGKAAPIRRYEGGPDSVPRTRASSSSQASRRRALDERVPQPRS